MGGSGKLKLGCIALVLFGCLTAHAGASPDPVGNPWLTPSGTVDNMAHQGGELEAPSSTMYAFRTALDDRGADSLEMDVNATSDGRLMVMHDYYTRRITPLDAQVRDLTSAQVQALDAAYWFSPGTGQFDHEKPADQYPLRGVRTGDLPPPAGYSAEDFRVPTIEEVLDAFPRTFLNIEIKTVPGEPEEGRRVARLLADVLNRPEYRSNPVIVASLDQSAIDEFHGRAPHVALSASLSSMMALIANGDEPTPRAAALQVPNVLGGLEPPAILQELGVAAKGYAVHAWTAGRSDENEEVYARLIESGVSGIISSAPSLLAGYLCGSGIRHPDGSPRCPGQLLRFGLSWPSRSLGKLVRGRLPLAVNCGSGCSVGVKVRIRARAARRLGIRPATRPDRRGLVVIGRRDALWPQDTAGPGRRVLRVGVFRQPSRRLARSRKASIHMTLTVRDEFGWMRSVKQRWLKLKQSRPAAGSKRR